MFRKFRDAVPVWDRMIGSFLDEAMQVANKELIMKKFCQLLPGS
jgi:hypothetical protein